MSNVRSKEKSPLVFKERLQWLLFLVPFFFLVYGTANQLTAFNNFVPSIVFEWEKLIPFIPKMIVPYMSAGLLFIFSFLLVKTRNEIQRHALRLGFAIVFSAVIFLLFPLHFSLEKPPVEGWTKIIFAGLAADLPYNQLPSLHVSLAMVVGYLYYTYFKGFFRWFFVVWFVLIAVSTLFVFQHHFIDLPAGVLVGFFTFYMIPISGKSRLPLNFVSFKHLYVALHYLLLSIVFTGLAFRLHSIVLLSLLSAWVAFSMLIIATLYVLGYNKITQKKNNGQIKLVYWLILWPYLLSNKILWKIWKYKDPPMVKVVNSIWLGRSLEECDEKQTRQNDIKTIIDLSPEICGYSPSGVIRHYQPLLDLSVPDPELIKEITEIISQAKEYGNVLILCKFGLSRSMIVSCAFLMTQGSSREQAWVTVSKARTVRMNKPYVHIALKLFESELN